MFMLWVRRMLAGKGLRYSCNIGNVPFEAIQLSRSYPTLKDYLPPGSNKLYWKAHPNHCWCLSIHNLALVWRSQKKAKAFYEEALNISKVHHHLSDHLPFAPPPNYTVAGHTLFRFGPQKKPCHQTMGEKSDPTWSWCAKNIQHLQLKIIQPSLCALQHSWSPVFHSSNNTIWPNFVCNTQDNNKLWWSPLRLMFFKASELLQFFAEHQSLSMKQSTIFNADVMYYRNQSACPSIEYNFFS